MMADSQRLMKEVLAGPFGSNGGPFGSSTQTPMEDALKEHLTAKGEEIVAGTVQLARDLNRRSYMDRAVSWLPGALLSRQASIVNTHETLSKMPAMLADIEENMDATLRSLHVVKDTQAILLDDPLVEPRAPSKPSQAANSRTS